MNVPAYEAFIVIANECVRNRELLSWTRNAFESMSEGFERLQQMYEEVVKQKEELEKKLKDAQKLYYNEKQKVSTITKERNKLINLLNDAKEILQDDNTLPKTKQKLSFLNQQSEILGLEKLEPIAELNSTDGLLSELSYTLDEDDISVDSSLRRSQRHKRAPCRFPSDVSLEACPAKKSKSRHQSNRYKGTDRDEQVIATTTVTVAQDGPVTARSVIEAIPSTVSQIHLPQSISSKYLPSAPPARLMDTDSDSCSSSSGPIRTPKRPFACQTNLRLHNWNQKSHIMGEVCSVCCKKMKFSTVAVKCSNCKAVAHSNCQERVPLPCVPVAMNTPNAKIAKSGNIVDFVPLTSPMVPSLVVHCVREIEARGFGEVGLYRVPGSDKEVKTLKEKLLKAKGVIDLSNVPDIHTVCGCLKEFLRSLKEPLIPQILWKELAQASDIPDGEQKKNRIFNFIQHLPQANRDTLAYIVLHLQRVAAAPNCKMPVANLSKMFGPSIIGYSKYDPDNILMETNVSNKIMAEFLLLPTECWEEILYPGTNENQNPEIVKTPSQSSLLGFFTNSTSSVKTVRKARKFFDTP